MTGRILRVSVVALIVLGSSVRTALRGTGAVRIRYEGTSNAEYFRLGEGLREEGLLEEIADGLNEAFELPADVIVCLRECGGDSNAYYHPGAHEIRICYELLDHLHDVFDPHEREDEDLEAAVLGATAFTIYHEVGHALIDLLDLPITGREEDAVDQLSTYILADGTDEGEQWALAGARALYYEDHDQGGDAEARAFWDEHSIDAQRFYNIVCWVYGQNPAKHERLVRDKTLPEERARGCESEFAQIEHSWQVLLAPYLKR
jgi:hypothetical protein